jgi:hypothetical protein
LFRDLLNMAIIKHKCNFALVFNTHSRLGKQKTPLLTGEFSLSIYIALIEASALFVSDVINITNAADPSGDRGGAVIADRSCA